MDVLQGGDLPKFVAEDVKGEVIYCQTCRALLNGPIQWQEHHKATQHQRKTGEQRRQNNLIVAGMDGQHHAMPGAQRRAA